MSANTYLFPLQYAGIDVPNIFCFPGAGASVSSFIHLIEAMDSNISVYGLESGGLGGIEDPHSSVTVAAQDFVVEILSVSPKGAYNLIGHSFGGWIAFEAATLLQKMNQEIGFVALLDTEPPSSDHSSRESLSRTDILLRLIGTYEDMLDHKLCKLREKVVGVSGDKQLELLLIDLIREGVFPKNSKISVVESIFKVFSTQVNARYKPKDVLSGSLFIFTPNSAGYSKRADSTIDLVEAWRQYSTTCCKVNVPGNHVTLLRKGNVEVLADHLKSIMKWPHENANSSL